MALFNKTDPATKKQRDLEAQLKVKRTARDDLSARRKAAETNAAGHREKARKLAGDGAEDAPLSAAETAMRREQDRVATLDGAIADAETIIAELEAEIAKIIDQRCRVETAAALTQMISDWESAGAAIDKATRELEAVSRETAPLLLDANGLAAFAMNVRSEVPAAVASMISQLQHHCKQVLSGHAPASLPKPEPEPVAAVIEPAPEIPTRPAHITPIMASDPVAQANITPFDRGVPERKLLTAGPQV